MTRSELQSTFVARFAAEGMSPRASISDDELNHAEVALGVKFPEAYREFAVTFGAVWTPIILESIPEDTTEEYFDVQQFTPGAELVQANELYWSGGMSSDLIGFANDCMGNLFCFRREDIDADRPDDCPVWLFDHDYCSERQFMDTFDFFIARYLSLPQTPNP